MPRENCRKVSKFFYVFWRFLSFFALRENCRKVSKIFLTLFWRFLTWPLSAGPFCNLLKHFTKLCWAKLMPNSACELPYLDFPFGCQNRMLREAKPGGFQTLAKGKYGCTEVRVYPTECGEQLGTDPSKIGELQIPCFEEFFWGGNTLGLVPASLPHALGYACTFYAPTSPSPKTGGSPTFFGKGRQIVSRTLSGLFLR